VFHALVPLRDALQRALRAAYEGGVQA